MQKTKHNQPPCLVGEYVSTPRVRRENKISYCGTPLPTFVSSLPSSLPLQPEIMPLPFMKQAMALSVCDQKGIESF